MRHDEDDNKAATVLQMRVRFQGERAAGGEEHAHRVSSLWRRTAAKETHAALSGRGVQNVLFGLSVRREVRDRAAERGVHLQV